MSDKELEMYEQSQLDQLDELDLLDVDMDKVDDAPGFVNPLSGVYLAELRVTKKDFKRNIWKDGKKTDETEDAIRLAANFKVVATIDCQIPESGEVPEPFSVPKQDDRFSKLYSNRRAYQQANKELLPVAVALGVNKLSEVLQTFMQDDDYTMLVLVTVKSRKSNNYVNLDLEDIEVPTEDEAKELLEAASVEAEG